MLTDDVLEGWINLPYSITRRAEGLPYFTGEDVAAGQWVRVVLTAKADQKQWWTVGKVVSWTDAEVVFRDLKFENGDCPEPLRSVVFSGRCAKVTDGESTSWVVSELQQK